MGYVSERLAPFGMECVLACQLQLPHAQPILCAGAGPVNAAQPSRMQVQRAGCAKARQGSRKARAETCFRAMLYVAACSTIGYSFGSGRVLAVKVICASTGLTPNIESIPGSAPSQASFSGYLADLGINNENIHEDFVEFYGKLSAIFLAFALNATDPQISPKRPQSSSRTTKR